MVVASSLKNMRFAYGAGAVYAGQPRYGLRVRNNAFDQVHQVHQARGIAETHARGKQFYVVANTAPRRATGIWLADARSVGWTALYPSTFLRLRPVSRWINGASSTLQSGSRCGAPCAPTNAPFVARMQSGNGLAGDGFPGLLPGYQSGRRSAARLMLRVQRMRALPAAPAGQPLLQGQQAVQLLPAGAAEQDQRQFGGDQGVGAGVVTLLGL